MSVLCSLTQISAHLLEIMKEHPPVLELFRSVELTDGESEKIDNIYGLPSNYIHLLNEVLAEPTQAAGQLTLWDLEEAENWRQEYPEEYERIKSKFYQILIEGKTALILDLGKAWDAIGYIFRGGVCPSSQPLLVNQTADGDPRIEVICGGANFEIEIRYLEHFEVQEIANSLASVSESFIRRRFEQGRREQPDLYRSSWAEEAYEGCLRYCTKVQEFYIDAAKKSNGILINLG
jgi:hypothetical protein